MKPSKSQRQAKILEIIHEKIVETQEELVDILRQNNMDVTQATISRDIKELGIVKVTTGDGRQKYVPLDHSGEVASGRFMKVFNEAIVSIALAENLVIIKTLPGMAQAAAAALDSMRLQDILGSIAGDDTIFVATASMTSAKSLQDKLGHISQLDPHRGRANT